MTGWWGLSELASDGAATGSSPGRGVMSGDTDGTSGLPDDTLFDETPAVTASPDDRITQFQMGEMSARPERERPQLADHGTHLDRIERKLDALLDHLGVEVDD